MPKGLESLIPKKNSGSPEPQSHPSPKSETNFDPPTRQPELKEKKAEPKAVEEDKDIPEGEAVFHIETEKIKPNPYQPRKNHDEEGLKELAQSIREVGIIQPIVVSKVEKEVENGTKVEYQLISGERRLRASKMLGLERVPAIVRRVEGTRDKLSVALIENIQRSDLNPMEAARAYAKLQDEFGLTQREVATKVGKSRATIANTVRLLNLPTEIQDAVENGKINESQARQLLSIKDPREQREVFKLILENKLSSKDLRNYRSKLKNSKDKEDTTEKGGRENRFWEKQLEERLAVPVKVVKKGNKGRLIIKFFSQDEWKNLLDKFLND